MKPNAQQLKTLIDASRQSAKTQQDCKQQFPAAFREARIEASMSQTQLARIAKISQAAVAMFEAGKDSIGLDTLELMLEAMTNGKDKDNV